MATTTIPLSTNTIVTKWKLTNIRPLAPSLSTSNLIILAYSEKYKMDVILKKLLTNTHESEALLFFNGNGCVNLLDYDPITKHLLLEYIQPGISLKTLFPKDDVTALEITAQLIKKLHTKNAFPQTPVFKTINQWLELLHMFKSTKIPAHLLKVAQQLSHSLLCLKQPLYILHGDLHHENILKKDNEWIAIDPKGVIGPLEYEVGRFIMNPIPDLLQQQNAKKIIQDRINNFSTIFGFDQQRLTDWVFVQAILSACWSEEDNNEILFNYFIKLATTIKDLSI